MFPLHLNLFSKNLLIHLNTIVFFINMEKGCLMLNETKLNKENNNESLERIWKIRDYIQELEDVKDEIVEFLSSEADLDNGTRNIWISDAKEFYFSTVNAWEMLHFTVRGMKNHLNDSKGFLFRAKSRLAQSISELKILDGKKISKMITKASIAFEKCWDAFLDEYKLMEPELKIVKPIQRVIKKSNHEYQLPCSICGEIAVDYRIGVGQFDKEEKLLYRGIIIGTSLNKGLADELFEIMEKEDIAKAHEFMKNHHSYEGLDAYCPECDKIYCWNHYKLEEEWDEGFYDCTYGECPKGHRRMIDD